MTVNSGTAGEAARSASQDVVFRQTDCIRVKGKDQAITIYEPLGEVDEGELARRDEALRGYRARQWQGYLKKVQDLRRNPPPPDWDGVTVFAEK